MLEVLILRGFSYETFFKKMEKALANEVEMAKKENQKRKA